MRYVLRCIKGRRAVLKPVAISCLFEEEQPAFRDLRIRPLANRVLLDYLKMEAARKVCKEAHFKQNGKSFLLLSFPIYPAG